MMRSNLGSTGLRRSRSTTHPLRVYDRLPPELRAWLARAVLPWRPESARKAFDRALAQTGSTRRALERLDAMERRLVARDAATVWGTGHPAAAEAPGDTRVR
jgi:hypothetical protein